MLFNVCKRMIERSQTEGIESKIDVFYAAGKLSESEYNELIAILHPVKEENQWM